MLNFISECEYILYSLKSFVECPIGYIGDNCTFPCDQSFYGNLCSLKCECLKCHHIYGCLAGKSITTNYQCLWYKIKYR